MYLQSLRIFIISLNANYRIAHLMPSRANDSFLLRVDEKRVEKFFVSMPSRANDSFLLCIRLPQD